ncbi:hypothetical protein MAR_029388 [Mya arenaria]|uniref:Uncharacterized protein n=1 Tax=Mya arenaria TaxID=6604 RepID=A0ABY7DIF2_MYAAR|nr:hypothetical protein MAR_029388 [Mya arenaria]
MSPLLSTVLQQDRIVGLWRGIVPVCSVVSRPLLLRDVPFSGRYFIFYTQLKRVVLNWLSGLKQIRVRGKIKFKVHYVTLLFCVTLSRQHSALQDTTIDVEVLYPGL